MQKSSKTKILLILSVFVLAALSCNLTDLFEDSGDIHSEAQVQQEQPATDQPPDPEPYAPTQALPRPTRPEGQSSLPKPTIPAPPAQTTRQPVEFQLESESAQQEPQDTQGETGTFNIVNDTAGMVICYFYMAFSSDPEWGSDRLGEEDMIYPGETYALTDVPFGTFDAIAEDCDGNLLAEIYGFDFPAADTFTLFDQ